MVLFRSQRFFAKVLSAAAILLLLKFICRHYIISLLMIAAGYYIYTNPAARAIAEKHYGIIKEHVQNWIQEKKAERQNKTNNRQTGYPPPSSVQTDSPDSEFSSYAVSAKGNIKQVSWRIVERVVDGDTIILDNGEKVRLIGVDTPEKHQSRKLDKDAQRSGNDKAAIIQLGERSSLFTKNLCESQYVRLEYEGQQKDRYNRTLAYVFLHDGRMVNREIIRNGYGVAYTNYPFSYQDEFLALGREARESRRGLYKENENDSKLIGQKNTPTMRK